MNKRVIIFLFIFLLIYIPLIIRADLTGSTQDDINNEVTPKWIFNVLQQDELDVSYEEINDTHFAISITPNNGTSLDVGYKFKIGIQYDAASLVLQSNLNSRDFERKIFSYPKVLNRLPSYFNMSFGMNSTKISLTQFNFTNWSLYRNNVEHLCSDNNGVLHAAFTNGNGTLIYSNSTNNGSTWTTNSYSLSTNGSFLMETGIICRPDNTIFIYGRNNKNGVSTLYGFNNTNGFLNYTIQFGQNPQQVSCTVDINNIIHCCYNVASGNNYLKYINSTNWSNNVTVNNSTFTSRQCDISTDNSAVYIFGDDTSNDCLQGWSSSIGWGMLNRVNISQGSLYLDTQNGHPDSIVLPDGTRRIGVVYTHNSDLLFCNSSSSHFTKWDCLNIDTNNSYNAQIGYSANNSYYVLYSNQSYPSRGFNSQIFYANSTDGGATWIKRIDTLPNYVENGAFPNINKRNMTNTLRFIFNNDTNNVLYDNLTIPYTSTITVSVPYNCFYNGSIIWDIDCSRYCQITNNTATADGVDWNLIGNGYVDLLANVTIGGRINLKNGCKINKKIQDGNTFTIKI